MRVPFTFRKSAGAPALFQITLADFIVRSAYQMGKTPLLPIFAASLGASDALLGLIVAISTLTGMATKPLFGLLSDRTGRRLWLLIGTLIFAGVPFLYQLIENTRPTYRHSSSARYGHSDLRARDGGLCR